MLLLLHRQESLKREHWFSGGWPAFGRGAGGGAGVKWIQGGFGNLGQRNGFLRVGHRLGGLDGGDRAGEDRWRE